jgi:hypothetical protein
MATSDSGDSDDTGDRPDDETDEERAEELAREASEDNPDPVTRREVLEGELEDEGLSDEGSEIGEHND